MRLVLTVLSVGVLAAGCTEAQTVQMDDIVKTLRQGGHVLVMRHASSPRETPSDGIANPDNPKLERQLDEMGRRGATGMGEALKRLKIPVGTVLASPAYRALETVRYAGFTSPMVIEELGDRGKSMQGVEESQARWLREKVTERPQSGNTLLVTHQPNFARAFPDWGSTVADGEVVVVRPNGQSGFTVVGRIPIETWPKLK